MQRLGRKIVVVGVSASGKSTFSRKLADVLHLPLTLMDAIMWNPGWQYIGDEQTAQKLDHISASAEWIIEGYITKSARSFVFDRADTIIYLDYASLVSSWRYLRRWWKYHKNPRPELPGSPESFSFTFLKLIWTKGEVKSLDKFLAKVDQHKIIVLHSPKEAQVFLKKV